MAGRKTTVIAEHIASLADRADNLHQIVSQRIKSGEVDDLVPGLVQRGSDQ